MTLPKSICACILTSRKWSVATALLAVLFAVPLCVGAQQPRQIVVQKDSIPMFRGFSVQFNIAGVMEKALSDRGQIEGALRLNLHDEYFPIVEIGYGTADHDDEVTDWKYKVKAPYFKVGVDKNLLKNKHTPNRLYGGLRYAFTSYKPDIDHPGQTDPVWGIVAPVHYGGKSCNQHWLELVFGVETKILGPVHLGWNARYKRRLSHKDPEIGNAWYVPGFGKAGSTAWGGDFNVIIDI